MKEAIANISIEDDIDIYRVITETLLCGVYSLDEVLVCEYVNHVVDVALASLSSYVETIGDIPSFEAIFHLRSVIGQLVSEIVASAINDVLEMPELHVKLEDMKEDIIYFMKSVYAKSIAASTIQWSEADEVAVLSIDYRVTGTECIVRSVRVSDNEQ